MVPSLSWAPDSPSWCEGNLLPTIPNALSAMPTATFPSSCCCVRSDGSCWRNNPGLGYQASDPSTGWSPPVLTTSMPSTSQIGVVPSSYDTAYPSSGSGLSPIAGSMYLFGTGDTSAAGGAAGHPVFDFAAPSSIGTAPQVSSYTPPIAQHYGASGAKDRKVPRRLSRPCVSSVMCF